MAAAALLADDPLPRGPRVWTAVGALAALTLWTGLSYEWAPLGERAQGDLQRLLLYLGTFVAGVGLFRGRLARRFLEPGLAAGTVLVTAYGLGDRLLPGLVTFHHSQSAEGRLEQPLTYWNAMGCLGAVGLVLCIRLAADRSRGRLTRATAGVGAPVLGLGVYLSFSRGALFALAAGVVVLVLLAPQRRRQLWVAAALMVAGAIAAAVANFLPRVESLTPGQTGDHGQGLIMLAVLVAMCAACAAVAATARDGAGDRPARGVVAGIRHPTIVAALLTVAVVGGLAGVAAVEGTPKARSTASATNPSRFRSADSLRYSYWDVALGAFARDPLWGTGSGGFAVEWRRRPKRPEPAVDAYSLYIETLAELGLVGALFLAGFLLSIASAAARLHARDPAAGAGPAAAFVVFAVHAGLDWDWEMPALTGIALLLAAALVAWDDEASRSADPLRSA
ncbi:MAG: O-antigen ligase family protein [Thermoleophilaceae bacterium]